jgi:hypothetical protein
MTEFEKQTLEYLERIADALETIRMLETDNDEALNDIKDAMPNLD